MEEPVSGLPASIDAAWGRRPPTAPGPKRALSLERIVDAGVTVAGSEGLAAVSMSRVASELGASTMALYRYVGAKDELLMLMVDAAMGPLPPGGAAIGSTWRQRLERWAWFQHAAERRHPWVVQVPIRGMPVTPNQVAFLENGLAGLGDTGLSEPEKFSVLLLVTSYVRAESLLGSQIGQAFAEAEATPGQAMSAYSRALGAVIDAERFPALTASMRAGFFDQGDEDPDAEFAFSLERILDGVEVLVRSRARRASPRRPAGGPRR